LENLRRISAETGQSVAELVRLAVESYLSAWQRPDVRAVRERARQAAGRFASGPNNASENLDEYLADAFQDCQ
jgi:hypothetical protein